jgi:hypothetical protein
MDLYQISHTSSAFEPEASWSTDAGGCSQTLVVHLPGADHARATLYAEFERLALAWNGRWQGATPADLMHVMAAKHGVASVFGHGFLDVAQEAAMAGLAPPPPTWPPRVNACIDVAVSLAEEAVDGLLTSTLTVRVTDVLGNAGGYLHLALEQKAGLHMMHAELRDRVRELPGPLVAALLQPARVTDEGGHVWYKTGYHHYFGRDDAWFTVFPAPPAAEDPRPPTRTLEVERREAEQAADLMRCLSWGCIPQGGIEVTTPDGLHAFTIVALTVHSAWRRRGNFYQRALLAELSMLPQAPTTSRPGTTGRGMHHPYASAAVQILLYEDEGRGGGTPFWVVTVANPAMAMATTPASPSLTRAQQGAVWKAETHARWHTEYAPMLAQLHACFEAGMRRCAGVLA